MNLVMSLPDNIERKVEVVVDGSEKREMEISGNDLYRLWKGELGKHQLRMEFEKDVKVHLFTFER